MDFEKHAVHTRRDASRGQRLDVLGLTGRHAVASAGQLQTVGHVEDDWNARAPKHRKGAHVHDEVVVAEACAALGDEYTRVAGVDDLGHRVAHVVGREELTLLDVDGAAGPRGGHDQVGLPAEERRNLEDVGDLGDRSGLGRLVNVGENRRRRSAL